MKVYSKVYIIKQHEENVNKSNHNGKNPIIFFYHKAWYSKIFGKKKKKKKKNLKIKKQ